MTNKEFLEKIKNLRFITPNYLVISSDTNALLKYIRDMYSILSMATTPDLFPYSIKSYKWLCNPNIPYEEQHFSNDKMMDNAKKYFDTFFALYSNFPPTISANNYSALSIKYRIEISTRWTWDRMFSNYDLPYSLGVSFHNVRVSRGGPQNAYEFAYASQLYYQQSETILYHQRYHTFRLFVSRLYIMHYRFLRKYFFLHSTKKTNKNKIFDKMSIIENYAINITKNTYSDKKIFDTFRQAALKQLGSFPYDINYNQSNLKLVFEYGNNYA